MAFLFSFHCDSPDQGSAKSRSGKFSLPRSAHLGEAVANLLGVQRWLLPGGEVAPPVQDVVMDQVWHPPIDPAPRGAVGLARIFAKKWRYKNERENHDRHHYPDHETCVVKRPLQPPGVKLPHLLEPPVKSFVDAEEPISGWRLKFIRILLVVLILEQEIHHGWNDRAGQKVGSQHGKDDGHR